jgi:GTP pyrophosphokinase
MVPLDTPLQTGDRVEILTTKQAHGPGRDWLTFVASANARQKIRQWYKRQDRDQNIARGRDMLDSELQKLGLGGLNDLGADLLHDVATQLSFKTADDVFAQVGYGALTVHSVLNRLGLMEVEEDEIPAQAPFSPPISGEVRVLGVGDLLTRLASDCHPAPGDDIVGYITRNRGVTIHRATCPRILAEQETERLVHVDWGPTVAQSMYPVAIVVTAWDREGLLRDVSAAVSEERVNITAASVAAGTDHAATIRITVRVASVEQLSRVFSRIERVKGVIDVSRETPRKAHTA